MDTPNKHRTQNSSDNLSQIMRRCFGSADGEFCSRKEENEEASRMREFVRQNEVTENEVTQTASDYLRAKNYPDQHIDRQLDKLKYFLTQDPSSFTYEGKQQAGADYGKQREADGSAVKKPKAQEDKEIPLKDQ